jgi:hypothetical protein
MPISERYNSQDGLSGSAETDNHVKSILNVYLIMACPGTPMTHGNISKSLILAVTVYFSGRDVLR